MSKVNLQRFAENDARFFALRLRMIREDNLEFAKEYEALIDKYEKLSIWFLLENFLTEVKKKKMRPYHSIKSDLEESISINRVNVKVVAGDFSKGTITMLKKNTAEYKLMKGALKLPLSQAIERMTKAVCDGYFNKHLKPLVIYIADKGSVQLKLLCECKGDLLFLSLRDIVHHGMWHVGDDEEVGFLSNELSTL